MVLLGDYSNAKRIGNRAEAFRLCINSVGDLEQILTVPNNSNVNTHSTTSYFIKSQNLLWFFCALIDAGVYFKPHSQFPIVFHLSSSPIFSYFILQTVHDSNCIHFSVLDVPYIYRAFH